MKVFISWSGERSHGVALLLRDWLPSVLQSLRPYVSSEDIDKGNRWFSDISSELEDASFGIVCLTKENLQEPWIMFEAGGLAKSVSKSRLIPLLIDLVPSDLTGPLVQFQATSVSKEEIWKMILAINKDLSEHAISEHHLQRAFFKWWPEFNDKFNSILDKVEVDSSESKMRSEREMLEEIIENTRTLARLIIGSRENRLLDIEDEHALIELIRKQKEAKEDELRKTLQYIFGSDKE